MLKALNQIIGFIRTVFEFFLNFIESLITALEALGAGIALPTLLLGYMPAIIGASVSVVLGVMVAKFIVGR